MWYSTPVMPEYPDIVVYMEALERRIVDRIVRGVRVGHPNLLRTADPPVAEVEGRRVTDLRRIGKRIAIGCEGDLWMIFHLMIAGRLHWRDPKVRLRRRFDLAAVDFEHGTLLLTEAGTKKRASLHLTRGRAGLLSHDPGGVDVFDIDRKGFAVVLTKSNHTLKRALTDPRLFSGIGNAYSDEILHRARLSPVMLTQKLSEREIADLFDAMRSVLTEWVARLREEAGGAFPEGVSAFRNEMAVHGRYGKPCPVCSSPVQRIRYANNETNYCVHCQTGGKLLADRVLSRLLKSDWPRSLEEMEQRATNHKE
jgi:formamidopyrimidine-DNA glycosylase